MTAPNDLTLYEENADCWWGPDDRFFRSLRSVGEFHLGLMEREWRHRLDGARVVELGCGGGYLSLGLAERGARVTGLDLSLASVRAARAAALRDRAQSAFLCADLYASPLPTGATDLVVMGDVLEHLDQPALALAEASRLLRPGGQLFISTFDRSALSTLMVVWVAEGVGLVPRGTHDPSLFIRPHELSALAREVGLDLRRLMWERPRVWRTAFSRTIHLAEASHGLGFSAFFTKVSQ